MIGKTITHFQANPKYSEPECDRHYVESHIGLVRASMLANPDRLSYYVGKVVREFDLNGGWSHPLTLWRYVWCHMVVDQSAAPGVDGSNHDPVSRVAMSRDGAVSFTDLKRTIVTEETLLDRQMPGVGGRYYLFDYVRRADDPEETARARVEEILKLAQDGMKDNIGASLLRVNWVEIEGDWQPTDGLTGKLRESTQMVAFVELGFDDDYWADRFFRAEGLAQRLLDPAFEIARGCEIETGCVFDRRDR